MENSNSTTLKIKFMCSYGGKIQSRSYDHSLIYYGGDTKILTVDRAVKFNDMIVKLTTLTNSTSKFCLKYQLPGEGLESLISVMDDDDVESLMVEYDRMQRIPKPVRIRLFLFPLNRTGTGYSGSSSTSTPTPTPDFLFGFDESPVFVYRMPVPVYSYLPVVQHRTVSMSGHVALPDESNCNS